MKWHCRPGGNATTDGAVFNSQCALSSFHWLFTAPPKIQTGDAVFSRHPIWNKLLSHVPDTFFQILISIKTKCYSSMMKTPVDHLPSLNSTGGPYRHWAVDLGLISWDIFIKGMLVHLVHRSSRRTSFWVKQNWKTHTPRAWLLHFGHQRMLSPQGEYEVTPAKHIWCQPWILGSSSSVLLVCFRCTVEFSLVATAFGWWNDYQHQN